MRGLFLTICAIISVSIAAAQEVQPQAEEFVKQELAAFTSIDIDAPARFHLIKLEAGEKPYIEYNTHGNYTSKFTAEVVTNGVLRISERSETKRESITEARIYFHTLNEISISKADVVIEGTLSTQLLDIIVSNNSHLVADIDVLDVSAFISGKSRVQLSGEALYQTADITTAQYDALDLECVSTIVSTAHNAVAKVDARERLEAKTSTGGTIYYKSEPVIFRSETTLFGGSISLL